MNRIGKTISSPGVWKGPEIDWQKEGLHTLSVAELGEIDHALNHLLALGNIAHASRHSAPAHVG
jgi:hypothetical protein